MGINGDKDDYLVLFRGVKLTKVEANRVGLSSIFGFAGVLLSVFIIKTGNRSIDYLVIISFVIFGYFLGNKIFKRPN